MHGVGAFGVGTGWGMRIALAFAFEKKEHKWELGKPFKLV